MKRMQILTAVCALGILWLVGCGSDDSISPSRDYAAEWAGDYSGTASFLLSNGRTGVSEEARLNIQVLGAKRISVAIVVSYTPLGSTRSADAYAIAELTSADPDSIVEETRSGNTRSLFILTRTEEGILADVTTTSRRYDGGWVTDQRLVIDAR